MKRSVLLVCVLCFCNSGFAASEPDWGQVGAHATELLQRYVQIASVNPPADTSGTARLLKAELASFGMDAEILNSGPGGKTNLLVRLPGRDRTKRPLLLLNHMDVVPADASRWAKNPFGGQIDNGQIWGRGTLDMKSTGIIQLTALTLLKQLGIVPSRDIVFVATCDEESGGISGATWMIENHWNKMNPEYVLDEGGAGSREVYTPAKLVFGVSVADKQVLWLKVKAQGTSGHGSQPITDNANDLLMNALEKAKQFPESTKPNEVVTEMHARLGDFAANKFMNAIGKNTISITSLRSGVGDPPKPNVIPSLAEATLDCRLLPGQNADEFVSEIRARINDGRIAVEQISPKPNDPKPSSSETGLYRAIEAAVVKRYPDATVLPIVVPYGTDGRKFRERGVTGYGFIPMIIDTETLATMHSDSEHIPIDQFQKGIEIYFDILRSEF